MNKLLLLLIAVSMLTACGDPTKSGRGFTLPEGDVERGEAVFIALQCNSCHKVHGRKDIPHADDSEITVNIGGTVRVIQNYGQLVTSVINPSHRISKAYPVEMVSSEGESKMTNYNSIMTVQQLTDVVAFLQAQYELDPVIRTRYPRYHYPKNN